MAPGLFPAPVPRAHQSLPARRHHRGPAAPDLRYARRRLRRQFWRKKDVRYASETGTAHASGAVAPGVRGRTAPRYRSTYPDRARPAALAAPASPETPRIPRSRENDRVLLLPGRTRTYRELR